jgi:pimeloyl-ACP methyl ester carboxylesterase
MGVSWATTFSALLLISPEAIEMRFEQVAPVSRDAHAIVRSPNQFRAIILIHGLLPHPWKDSNVPLPSITGWEKSGSVLVKTLSPLGDVFALGYGQNAAIGEIAKSPHLQWNVTRLRSMGYQEVVLIGHSSGGLIARYYVEDQPTGGGVTKVIQVCSPNGGTSWGKRTAAVRGSQEAFLKSLTKEARIEAGRARADKRIPQEVQFACVLGSIAGIGDGIVRTDSQWTSELQQQGIPAIQLNTTHVTAMRSKAVAFELAALVKEPMPRWTAEQVGMVKKAIFGNY